MIMIIILLNLREKKQLTLDLKEDGAKRQIKLKNNTTMITMKTLHPFITRIIQMCASKFQNSNKYEVI